MKQEPKQDIEIFIDGIVNPSEPNQALKDAAQRYEKYSERFDNDESAIGNPETWGKRVLTEEDIFNQRDIDAVTDYIGKETSKQETLEEVAERILANNIDGLRDALKDDDLFFFYKGVVQCYGEAMAEWQQEQMYSEEDMMDYSNYRLLIKKALSPKEWFEKFKNK